MKRRNSINREDSHTHRQNRISGKSQMETEILEVNTRFRPSGKSTQLFLRFRSCDRGSCSFPCFHFFNRGVRQKRAPAFVLGGMSEAAGTEIPRMES